MTTIYVDSLLGNDSNLGTEAQPKQTVKAAEAAATVFDKIALRAGRCYAPVNGFFPRLQKNGLELTAYGLTDGADKWLDYPTLDGLTYENANATGWTHEGDGVWSKVFANAKAKRIWFGSNSDGVLTTQRTIGTAYRRTPTATADTLVAIKAALNSTDRWHPAGSALGWKLYVYTGSTAIAPPAYYSGLAILICDGATIGAEEGIYATQASGVRVSKIHVRGAHGDSGRIASLTTDTAATDDIIFDDCISSCNGVANVWSIRVGSEANANPRKKISNSYLKNIEADSKTSEYEQDPTIAYNAVSAMDMFVITGNTENCHILDFKAINSAHVGAAMGGQENNEPVNCSIRRGYIKFDSFITYGRGLATSRMTNSFISECVIDGQNVRSQFADGHIVGNKWINNRASIRKAGTDEWGAVECYVYDYGNPAAGVYQYETRQPRDLLIANNVVDRPVASGGAYPLLFTTYSSTYPVAEPNPPINSNTVRVYNNIVILDTARSWLGSFANGGAINDQLVKNNIVYTGAGNADATVRWAGATVGMNVRAGQIGNISSNPLLSTALSPMAGSPAIKAGIAYTPLYTSLNGTTFNASTPTIGAYEIASIINARDAALQVASVRYTPTTELFHSRLTSYSCPLAADATGVVASFASAVTTFNVFRGSVNDNSNWVFSGVGTNVTFSVTGNTFSVSSISADTGYIDITATRSGYPTQTARFSVAKVRSGTSGTNGTNGTRGTVQVMRQITGNTWSNTEAANAIAGVAAGYVPLHRDIVTLYNNSASPAYSETRYYDGSTWVNIGQYLHGNVFVEGGISANKIDTRGLDIKDASGNTIFSAGTNLSSSRVAGLGGFATLSTITSANISTYIAAAAIGDAYIDSLSANKINGGTITGISFQTATSYGSNGRITINSASAGTDPGKIVAYDFSGNKAIEIGGGSGTVYVNSYSSLTSTIFGRANGSGMSGVTGEATSGVAISGTSDSGHGVRGTSSSAGTAGLVGASNGYNFYAAGTPTGSWDYGTFTGAHDTLIKKESVLEIGDIMVDVKVIAKAGHSTVICETESSTSPYQKAVVGVYVGDSSFEAATPNALYENPDIYYEVKETHKYSVMNSLGEGMINVCGENGDIEAGDLIVSSSMAGKGMKQGDHKGVSEHQVCTWTVAKSRESVTFDYPTQVKSIACTYLCG